MRIRRAVASGLCALLAATGLGIGVANAADPEMVTADLEWSQVTLPTQSANATFSYLASVTCNAPENEKCSESVLTIPLPADYPDAAGSNPMANWNYKVKGDGPTAGVTMVVDKDVPELRITIPELEPLQAGLAPGVQVDIRPGFLEGRYPYYAKVPNNTTWTLQPTLSGENFPTVTAPNSVASTATNSFNNRAKKTGPTSVVPGGLITYEVGLVKYSLSSLDSAPDFQPFLVDTLPDEVDFVEATGNGVYNPATRTVTFRADANPEATPQNNQNYWDSINEQVTVRVKSDVPIGTQIINHVTGTAKGIGEENPVSKDASASTAVTELKVPGEFSKVSGGNLGTFGDVNWKKKASGHSSSLAQYSLIIQGSQNTDFNWVLEDQLPCLDDDPTAEVVRPKSQGSVCENPAFRITNVSIGGFSLTPFTLELTYTDGTTDTSNVTSSSNAFPSAGKTIASIRAWGLAKAPTPSNNTITVYGQPAKDLEFGTVIWNDLYYGSSAAHIDPVLGPTPDSDYLEIADRAYAYPQSQDLTFAQADRLTAGSGLGKSQFSPPAAGAEPKWGVLVPDVLMKGVTLPDGSVPNFEGSGRTLIPQVGSTSIWKPNSFWIGAEPGRYPVEVFAGFDGYNLTECWTSGWAKAPNATLVPDGQKYIGGSGDGAVCMAEGSITITANIPTYQTQKSVSLDGIDWVDGHNSVVADPGAEFQYKINWTNIGNTTISGATTYDILPYPNDTGIASDSLDKPRGSTMAPVLTSRPTAPSGWTIAHSDSYNPCRPEVGVSTDCDDNWVSSMAPDQVNSWRLKKTATAASSYNAQMILKMQLPSGVDGTGIAWNTAASKAYLPSGDALVTIESPKVGTGAEQPGFTIAKTLTETPALGRFSDHEFEFQYYIDGVLAVDDKGDPIVIKVKPGEEVWVEAPVTSSSEVRIEEVNLPDVGAGCEWGAFSSVAPMIWPPTAAQSKVSDPLYVWDGPLPGNKAVTVSNYLDCGASFEVAKVWDLPTGMEESVTQLEFTWAATDSEGNAVLGWVEGQRDEWDHLDELGGTITVSNQGWGNASPKIVLDTTERVFITVTEESLSDVPGYIWESPVWSWKEWGIDVNAIDWSVGEEWKVLSSGEGNRAEFAQTCWDAQHDPDGEAEPIAVGCSRPMFEAVNKLTPVDQPIITLPNSGGQTAPVFFGPAGPASVATAFAYTRARKAKKVAG